MIADLMPRWLRRWLRIDDARFDDKVWTWRHTLRFGHDPARILRRK
jgi:hypothetical protein